MSHHPTIWSYGIAAAAFLAFALRLALAWRGGRPAWVLLGASLASAAWAACNVAALAYSSSMLWEAGRWLNALRLAAWFAFLWVLLEAGRGKQPWVFALTGALLLAGTLLPQL